MRLCFETCADLPPVPAGVRAAIAAGPVTRSRHARVLHATEALHRIEVGPPSALPAAPADSLRIAYWNAERCKYLDASADLLARAGAGVTLLSEMDLGMARSGQIHTTRQLAGCMGQGYVFAVEYLELGLGDAGERAWHAGSENLHGLHGAAIVSPRELALPALIRLDDSGDWFDGSRGERRVGGRMAVAATVSMGDTDLAVVSVHLESHSDPSHRAEQMSVLLDAVEQYAPGGPAIIGGDFNTNSVPQALLRTSDDKVALAAEAPDRLVDPVPFEPLFKVAAAAGYEWSACNAPGATQRTRPDGTPKAPLGRLDWFLTRGLAARDPATLAATDGECNAISDHDLLVTMVSPTP